MIVHFTDIATGTAAYLNPTYVTTVRPDPADPTVSASSGCATVNPSG
jgi:hypothetical protein